MKTRDFIRQTPYIAWALMFTNLSWGLFSNFYGSLTPEIASDLTLSAQNLGILIVIMSIGGAVGAFLGGDIAHRFPPRPLLFGYLTLIAASIATIVSSKTLLTLCIGYSLYSATSSAIMTVCHSMLAYLKLGEGIRPRLLAMLDVGFSAGATLSPLWVALLLSIFHDWRVPFIMFTLPLAIIITSLVVPKARTDFQQIVADTQSVHDDRLTGVTVSSYWSLISAPWARWTWICGITIGYVEWGNAYWFVNYATLGREISANNARIGLAAFTGGMMAIRIWQAFLHSNLSNSQRMKYLSMLGSVMFVLLFALPSHAHVAWVATASALAGIGIGIVFPMLLNHLIEQAPHDTSKCSALLMLCIILGSQLAGLIVGTLTDHVSIFSGYLTIALSMVCFTYGVWQIYKPHQTIKN